MLRYKNVYGSPVRTSSNSHSSWVTDLHDTDGGHVKMVDNWRYYPVAVGENDFTFPQFSQNVGDDVRGTLGHYSHFNSWHPRQFCKLHILVYCSCWCFPNGSSLSLLLEKGDVELTEDGYEKCFQSNYLGHFLLTILLTGKMRKAVAADSFLYTVRGATANLQKIIGYNVYREGGYTMSSSSSLSSSQLA